MPISNVINAVSERQSETSLSGDDGGAPTDDNAPTGDPKPPHMDTWDGLPPYLHISTLDGNSGVKMLGPVMGLLTIAKFAQEHLE